MKTEADLENRYGVKSRSLYVDTGVNFSIWIAICIFYQGLLSQNKGQF